MHIVSDYAINFRDFRLFWRITMTYKNQLLVLTLVLLTGNFSHAEVVDNGIYRSDTETGLDWLDLTETLSLSPLDIKELLQPGQRLEGWRYASLEELNLYIEHSIGVPVENGSAYTDVTVMGPVMDSIGVTEIFFSEENQGNIVFSVGIYQQESGYEKGQLTQYLFSGLAFYAHGLPWNEEDSNESIGSFLVRENFESYSCNGFSAPADKAIALNKAGRTIPLKATITDENNTELSNLASPKLRIEAIGAEQCSTSPVTFIPPVSSDGVGDDFYFSGDRWNYNLSTANLSSGTYEVFVTAGSTEYRIDGGCSFKLFIK